MGKKKDIIKKLDRRPVLVLSGEYQNGKSTFLNCLLGGNYAVEGDGTFTTKYNTKYTFGDFRELRIVKCNGKSNSIIGIDEKFDNKTTLKDFPKNAILQVSEYSPLLNSFDIIDSPGFSANDSDNTVADNALDLADFVVCVLTKMPKEEEIKFLHKVQKHKKYFTVVFNCKNDLNPKSNMTMKICREIYAKIKSDRLIENYVPLSEQYQVYPMNLLWTQCAIRYMADEELKTKIRKVKDFIDDDDLDTEKIWRASNFHQMRNLLSQCVLKFFRYEAVEGLDLLKKLSKSWETAMIDALQNN